MRAPRKGVAGVSLSVAAVAFFATPLPAAAQPAREAASYREVIGGLGTQPGPEEHRHIAQLSVLLPPHVLGDVLEKGAAIRGGSTALKPNAGEVLLRWWRTQDPMPASEENERLHEHLRRVRHAEEHFARKDAPAGYDERGDVWVRYGAPSRRTVIAFDAPEFIDAVYRSGVAVSPTDFPENEFWRYTHVHRDAYFLFVRDGGGYRHAGATDLLPRVLQYGFNAGVRGRRKTEMALHALRTILRQLALEHPDYAPPFHDVDVFATEIQGTGRLRDRSISEIRVGIPRAEIQGELPRGYEQGRAPAHELPPHEFIQHALSESKTRDAQAARRRRAAVPEDHTEALRGLERLPMAVRTARFLDDDYTTRTEIYWSPEPGGLTATGEGILLRFHAIRRGADYRRMGSMTRSYYVTDLPDVEDATIPARTTVLRGDTATVHLALQWDRHPSSLEADGRVRVGRRMQVGTAFVDSLAPLRTGTLEMSDIKPVLARDEARFAETGRGDPYPHRMIWPALPLGLHFEIYGLTPGKDGRTRYTVAYGLEGGREPVAASISHVGDQRTARESVVLDLADRRTSGPVIVRVTVTDEVAARQVTRALPFHMER